MSSVPAPAQRSAANDDAHKNQAPKNKKAKLTKNDLIKSNKYTSMIADSLKKSKNLLKLYFFI